MVTLIVERRYKHVFCHLELEVAMVRRWLLTTIHGFDCSQQALELVQQIMDK